MKKGFLHTITFYGIGFSLSGVAYKVFGHPYIHAPGIHHIIMFLTFLSGIVLLSIDLYHYLKNKPSFLKGTIISNILIILCFTTYLYTILK
ncbi:hypothetical protein [uncultured Tenacibaculum sp.]|uniref:hypothetical protein n=1 Tax=uncultured Tenacibaculum sp. TaxID=174713 RepID=UPI002624FDBC|nr:hypothetical protein [uncultured Tenacibaculum sp.]